MLTCATWSRPKRKKAEEERRLASAPRLRPSLGAPSPAARASAPKRKQAARAAAGAPRVATPPSAAECCPDLGRPGPRRRGALSGFPGGWAHGAARFRATAKGAGGGPGAGRRERARCGRPARGRRRAQVKGRARHGAGDGAPWARSQWPPRRLRRRRARSARTVPGQTGFCGCACECASECKCVCARARSPVSALGGRARLRAGLQEARLSWPPPPTS